MSYSDTDTYDPEDRDAAIEEMLGYTTSHDLEQLGGDREPSSNMYGGREEGYSVVYHPDSTVSAPDRKRFNSFANTLLQLIVYTLAPAAKVNHTDDSAKRHFLSITRLDKEGGISLEQLNDMLNGEKAPSAALTEYLSWELLSHTKNIGITRKSFIKMGEAAREALGKENTVDINIRNEHAIPEALEELKNYIVHIRESTGLGGREFASKITEKAAEGGIEDFSCDKHYIDCLERTSRNNINALLGAKFRTMIPLYAQVVAEYTVDEDKEQIEKRLLDKVAALERYEFLEKIPSAVENSSLGSNNYNLLKAYLLQHNNIKGITPKSEEMRKILGKYASPDALYTSMSRGKMNFVERARIASHIADGLGLLQQEGGSDDNAKGNERPVILSGDSESREKVLERIKESVHFPTLDSNCNFGEMLDHWVVDICGMDRKNFVGQVAKYDVGKLNTDMTYSQWCNSARGMKRSVERREKLIDAMATVIKKRLEGPPFSDSNFLFQEECKFTDKDRDKLLRLAEKLVEEQQASNKVSKVSLEGKVRAAGTVREID